METEISPLWELEGEPGRIFSEDPEGYLKEGSGNGHLSIVDPLGAMEGGGVDFTGNFERKPDNVLSG
jgi:hypothetical protein